LYITACFSNNGTPATGLSPTIRIRDLSDNSLVVTDAAMSEVGDGYYKYNFSGYDKDKDYAIRCDGGATLSGYDRYTYGSNRDDLEMSDKLPTNYIMGSSDGSDKDDEIDDIKTVAEENSFFDTVYIDHDSGISGTTFPNGTPQHPVDNLPDAKTIADARNIKKFEFLNGSSTLTEDMNGYDFKHASINIDGYDIDNCNFEDCVIQGVQGGGAPFQNPSTYLCLVANITNLNMSIHKCVIGGNNTILDGASSVWYEITFITSILTVQAPNNLKIYDAQGEFTIAGMDGGTLTIFSKDANITVDNTCTAGTLYIYGSGFITDNSNGTIVIETLRDEKVNRLLGLADENAYVDQYVTDVNGRMTSCRKRVYDSKANAEAHGATGLRATYAVTVTYSGDDLDTFLMTLE